ncbi:hypothetical protein A4R43_15050 [Amycolatopsis albispora]|uniref:Nucleoside phosphorylase domain-containing protein n=1 Tax=Amycolatopsis albispora TaxID=1804986 RepID=A0A344L6L2_9PSEU|nr:hypothetical protein A4R43_15050 [Amycolatopsis albispora]
MITERAITTFAPQALLFVGVAGALDDDLESGDIVVATKVYGYHGGKEEDSGFLTRPQAWEASYVLEELARHTSRLGAWTALVQDSPNAQQPQVHFKPVAAGEVVLNSRTTPLAAQLHTTYNDAAAIEMESAGVAKAGHLNHNLPTLAIRGISDKADGNKHTADKAGGQPIAAANAAAFAIALTETIPADGKRHTSNTEGAARGQKDPGPGATHPDTTVTDSDGSRAGKYRMLLRDNKGVQAGEHNTQHNTFN